MARKSADAFRTISEVADWLGVQPHVLRFWESKFTQVKPVKRAGGRRYYRPQDMLLLGGIRKLLHGDGLTIKGAQKILREEGVAHVSAMSHPLDGDSAAPLATPEMTSEPEPTPTPAPAPGPDESDVARLPSFLTGDTPAPAVAEAEDTAPTDLPSFLRPVSDTPEERVEDGPVAAAPELEPEDGPVAPVRKPTTVHAPDPDEAEIDVSPGMLSAAFGVRDLSASQRARLMPMIAELAALRDRMAAER